MLLGRNNELRQLTEIYGTEGNEAVVLYGRLGIGKTALALAFSKDKPTVFYSARELSEKEQLLLFLSENGGKVETEEAAFSYFRSMKQIVDRNPDKKTLFIIDEFHNMQKSGNAFSQAVITMMKDEKLIGKCMFLFLSSSVNWVENSMVADLGQTARFLSGIIKLHELSFTETLDRFPHMKIEDAIYVGAILGGVPGLLDYWSEKQSVKENVIRLFLNKRGPLRNEAECFLKQELRELPAYNAILATLAAGNYKLNDIYARTGFSRAKISVYLKNLIELDVVEKVFSFDTGEYENVKKGMYCIKDKMLAFWYRYVFPNMSMLEKGMEREVYDNIIAYDFDNYMSLHFGNVCLEYMKLMSSLGKLDRKYDEWGKWYGKTGNIDIVAKEGNGKTLVGFCSFETSPVGPERVQKYRDLLQSAGIKGDETFVFAKSGFEDSIKISAAYDKWQLINMDEL